MTRKAGRTARITGALICLVWLACAVQKEGSIHEPIEMGPWKFRVERALDSIVSNAGGDQIRTVTIEMKLDNYMERHEKNFDDFLNGNRPGALIAYPGIKLVDKDGTGFDGWATPDSGGSLRSEGWTVRFQLVPDSISLMKSIADRARPYLDKDLADFRLVITNPDRQSGQAGSVSIRLK